MSNVIALHEKSVIQDAPTAWKNDCGFGHAKAESLILEIRSNGDYPSGMAEIRQLVGSEWSGVEVGFFQRLLELAVSSAPDARTQCLAPDQ